MATLEEEIQALINAGHPANSAREIALLRRELARERERREAAEEAALIAGQAAQNSANTKHAAADANYPWYAHRAHYKFFGFSAYIPYLKLTCAAQHRRDVLMHHHMH